MSDAQQVKAQILSIEPVGSYFHMVLEAPTIAEHVLPGHFVAIAVGGIGSGIGSAVQLGHHPRQLL
jgi:dihydroorotate dehydrogenase electron transfer subunit